MEVLGTACGSVVGCQGKTALVVLKRFGANRSLEFRRKTDHCRDSLKHASQRQKGSKGHRQGGVLGLESQESDLRLKLGLPNQRAAAELDDVSGARSSRVDVSIGFALVQTGEIGVAEQLELEVAMRIEDHPFVGGPSEVAHDGLDGSGVQLLRVVANQAAWLTTKEMSGRVLVDR
jgi:hypothetical protein